SDKRQIHSFATRRSSDLWNRWNGTLLCKVRQPSRSEGQDSGPRDQQDSDSSEIDGGRTGNNPGRGHLFRCCPSLVDLSARYLDRSEEHTSELRHLVISYA